MVKTSTPGRNRFGSSATRQTMFDGIALTKATASDFQNILDALATTTLPEAVKAALATVAYASDEDYRDANFIVDDIDYLRAEAAAQAVRCRMSLDGRPVSSEFAVNAIPLVYAEMFFTVFNFLSGDKAEREYRSDPLGCAMGWMILDPVGFGRFIQGLYRRSTLYPV